MATLKSTKTKEELMKIAVTHFYAALDKLNEMNEETWETERARRDGAYGALQQMLIEMGITEVTREREEKIAWAKAATEQELLQQYNRSIEAAARCPLFSEENLTHKAGARIVEEELLARIAAWKEAQR